MPKPTSQSGRRLFVLTKTELWLDMHGQFTRWILRANGETTLAGKFPIDRAYYRGETPENCQDIGAYEIIEGSERLERFELWFSGKTMTGAWSLEKKSAECWVLRAES